MMSTNTKVNSPTSAFPMEVASTPGAKPLDSNLQAYFDYYRWQFDYYRSEHGLSIFKNFGDFIGVVNQIKNGLTADRIVAILQDQYCDNGYAEHVFQDALDLVVRTYTLVCVGSESGLV